MKKIFIIFATICGFFISENSWALCANYTTYADGQVLTAGSLNSLQTNYTNCTNNVLDGDTFTGTMSYHSGADINVYSDTGSTLKAQIDGATGDVIISPRTIGTAINCEINYAAGTITISGRGGAALSATNPCHIGIRSNSNGVVATATFTANVTTTDGATSDTDSNLFGITDANWANAMPMFFGVIYDGTTPYFGFSRKPLVVSGSAATDLCQEGDTDCDGANDFFIMTTGLTLASWVNLPITQVSWLSATYATTGGAWTFAESAYTGFNSLYKTQSFTYPAAQNGAATGSFLQDNAGTAPIFTTQNYIYKIDSSGMVYIEFNGNADGGTDGAGAVIARLTLPMSAVVPSGGIRNPSGYALGATTITGGTLAIFELTNGNVYCEMGYFSAATTFASITNAMFSNGAREIHATLSYRSL